MAFLLGTIAACDATTQLPPGEEGCVIAACHGRVEQAHYGGLALSCVDCHGGNPTGVTKETAHPTVNVSFNPSSPGGQAMGGQLLAGASIVQLDQLAPEIVRFLNPADYRVVAKTCGSATRGGGNCHTRIADNSVRSLHATLAGQLAGGLYFAGLTDKSARFAVRATVDPFPIDDPGFIASLTQLPLDPSSLPGGGPAEQAYFASVGEMCVECHLSRDGTTVPGKYTSSGCNGCHLLTHDDGRPMTTDPTQDVEEGGHGALHRLTNLIPDAQCNHCHHAHLHRGLLSQGVRERSEPDGDKALGGPNRGIADPPNVVFWDEEHYVRHQGGYNQYGKPYPFYIADEDGTNDLDETPPDVHTQKGLACIDCHVMAELHGGDHMPIRIEFETRVRCESCHGSPDQRIDLDTLPFVRAQSRTGGNANNAAVISTGDMGELQQIGKLDRIAHPVTQIARRVDPTEARFNPRTQMGCALHAGSAAVRAALAERFAATESDQIDDVFPGMPRGSHLPADLGTRRGRLECFACHNAWTLNCYGCHIVRDDRSRGTDRVTGMPLPGQVSTFAMSVVPDALALGFDTRGRIAPMVGTSIFFSHVDADGKTVVNASPLTTVDGFSGDGNQHNPVHHHTVQKLPRDCTGCHPRADGQPDDEDALKRAIGFGTGRFVFVDGEGKRHLLDRLVAIDFDGDGESDDPETTPLGNMAAAARPLAATTHLAISADAATLGPGPLDVETINRMLGSSVLPQRGAPAEKRRP